MRYLLRVVLPLTLAFTAVLVALYLSSDDPRYAVSRVFDSPEQRFTWLGFATVVTVMCGASLTLVTNIADFCRYTPTRRDVRVGYFASALAGVVVTTFVGGYAAAATGSTNPFVAVADLTGNDLLLVLLLAALVVQTIAANITNAYTAGLSLVNAVPRLGRFWATVAVALAAIGLSAFPDFINDAQKWIGHLGNVAAPLTGVILADYLLLKRTRIDVPALFDPQGRYRYLKGINAAALAAVAVGVAVYYSLPHDWLKIVWGIGVGAAAYLALNLLQAALAPRLVPDYATTATPASSQRSSSPS
jgi:cytosine/uracil/thiamine/allantoin permease